MKSSARVMVSMLILTVFILGSFAGATYHVEKRSSNLPAAVKEAKNGDGSRWAGTEKNILWLRSDLIDNESYYYMDVESRVQVPGQPNSPQKDKAEVNATHNSEALAVQFRYPKLSSSTPPINSQYLSNIDPHVVLYVNSQSKAGRSIAISLSFDVNGDGNYEYIADFNNYTTKRNYTVEEAVFNFQGWRGGAAPSGPMTNGAVLLKVWRTDNLAEEKGEPAFQIYCGFYNKTSWVGVPYNVPEVMPVADVFEQGEGPDHIGFTWEGQDPIYFDIPFTFDASNSTDPDSSTIYFQWLFGDGTVPTQWSTNPKVQHTFVPPYAEARNKSYNANYTVQLTVKDDDDHYDSLSFVCHVQMYPNFPPEINLTAANVLSGVVDQTITFTCSAWDRDDVDDELEYQWDFGDGSTSNWVKKKQGGNQVAHAYSSEGTYTVTVRVRDTGDAMSTDSLDIVINENEAPTAVIKVTSANVNTTAMDGYGIVNVGDVFTVDASDSTDEDGIPKIFVDGQWKHIMMYKWETGDGRTSDQVPIDHDGDGDTTDEEDYDGDGWVTYTSFSFNYTSIPPGNVYTITLHVRDGPPENELTKEGTAEYKIWVNTPPEPQFTVSSDAGNPTDGIENKAEVTFDATSTVDSDPYDTGKLTYYWDFGDGGIDAGADKAVVKHTYNLEFGSTEKEKTVTAKLIVVDSQGAQEEYSLNIKIIPTNKPPKAMATVNDMTEVTVYTNEKITLDASKSYDQDLFGGAIAHYYWDVDTAIDSDGDGDTANDHDLEGVNVTYSYSRPGTYSINLIVVDNKGLTDDLKDTGYLSVTVNNQPPTAKINTLDGTTEFTTDDVIVFTAEDSRDPDSATPSSNGIVKYEWDFDGDGSVDYTSQNESTAKHQFTKAGQYKVKVIVYDSQGDTGEAEMSIFVKDKDTDDNGKGSPGFDWMLMTLAIAGALVLVAENRRRR